MLSSFDEIEVLNDADTRLTCMLISSTAEMTSVRRQKRTAPAAETQVVAVNRDNCVDYNSTAATSRRCGPASQTNLSQQRQQQAGDVGETRKQVMTTTPSVLSLFYVTVGKKKTDKKLSCRRETARRFVSLNILPSHLRSLKAIRNDTVELVCKSLLVFH